MSLLQTRLRLSELMSLRHLFLRLPVLFALIRPTVIRRVRTDALKTSPPPLVPTQGGALYPQGHQDSDLDVSPAGTSRGTDVRRKGALSET